MAMRFGAFAADLRGAFRTLTLPMDQEPIVK
jgi:hypothetical protein